MPVFVIIQRYLAPNSRWPGMTATDGRNGEDPGQYCFPMNEREENQRGVTELSEYGLTRVPPQPRPRGQWPWSGHNARCLAFSPLRVCIHKEYAEPSFWKATQLARLTAMVVLPTPPFWLTRLMIMATP